MPIIISVGYKLHTQDVWANSVLYCLKVQNAKVPREAFPTFPTGGAESAILDKLILQHGKQIFF